MEANIEYIGVRLVVLYDYEEGEEQTWDYSGSAPQVELEAVYVEDSEIDILDIFTWNQQSALEDIILQRKEDY